MQYYKKRLLKEKLNKSFKQGLIFTIKIKNLGKILRNIILKHKKSW